MDEVPVFLSEKRIPDSLSTSKVRMFTLIWSHPNLTQALNMTVVRVSCKTYDPGPASKSRFLERKLYPSAIRFSHREARRKLLPFTVGLWHRTMHHCLGTALSRSHYFQYPRLAEDSLRSSNPSSRNSSRHSANSASMEDPETDPNVLESEYIFFPEGSEEC